MEAPPTEEESEKSAACKWPSPLWRCLIIGVVLLAAAAAAAAFSLRPAASAGAVAAAVPSLPGDPNCPQMAGMVMPCPGTPTNATDGAAPH